MGEIFWSIVNSNVWKRFSHFFLCFSWGRPCHQKETPLSHISHNQNCKDFLPPKSSSQAIGLANISKCDVLRVPGANNWTNTTVIEACWRAIAVFRVLREKPVVSEWKGTTWKSTTRRTHLVGNFQHFAEFSAFWPVSVKYATYFRSFQIMAPRDLSCATDQNSKCHFSLHLAATVWNQWTTTTDSRLHRFRRLVMVGKPQLYTYNLFNLFVVKGLPEFICICLLPVLFLHFLSPNFHFPVTFQPFDLSSSRGCKSSSPQHLPSNWESLWYEVACFQGVKFTVSLYRLFEQ